MRKHDLFHLRAFGRIEHRGSMKQREIARANPRDRGFKGVFDLQVLQNALRPSSVIFFERLLHFLQRPEKTRMSTRALSRETCDLDEFVLKKIGKPLVSSCGESPSSDRETSIEIPRLGLGRPGACVYTSS